MTVNSCPPVSLRYCNLFRPQLNFTLLIVGRNTWSVTKAKKLAKIFDEKIFAVAGEAGSPLNKLLEDMAVSSGTYLPYSFFCTLLSANPLTPINFITPWYTSETSFVSRL